MPNTRRCFQLVQIVNLSNCSPFEENTWIALDHPRSLELTRLSRHHLQPKTDQSQSYLIYGLKAYAQGANVTVSVRPTSDGSRDFSDLNQSLAHIASGENGRFAQWFSGWVYATYAVKLPVEATGTNVLVTVHSASSPVYFSDVLIVEVPDPGDDYALCLNVVD